MRAATRERMISIMALVLVISICFLVPKAAAQSDKYSKMAPVNQYLMERDAADSCVRSRSCKVVRRNGRTHASRVD